MAQLLKVCLTVCVLTLSVGCGGGEASNRDLSDKEKQEAIEHDKKVQAEESARK